MPLVGTVGIVDLHTDPQGLREGPQVLEILRSFQQSGDADALLTVGKRVTVKIMAYNEGSGAVCLYRARTIKISKDLPGGPEEMAESILFELLNWEKGDFATEAYLSVKDRGVSPRDAGETMARIEAEVTYRHAAILRKLKSFFRVGLSSFGERNLGAVTVNLSLADFKRQFCASPHDANAGASNPASLPSAEMYAYGLIENRDPSEILGPTLLRGLSPNAPPWFAAFVTEAVKWIPERVTYRSGNQVITVGDTRCQVYRKLAKLAERYGMTLGRGYEFSPKMNHLAFSSTLSQQFQSNLTTRVLKTVQGLPNDLDGNLRSTGMLP
jgi:hypothetical protein